VYAVGDVVKPGLLADAIGQGRVAALSLHARVTGEPFELPRKQVIPPERLKLLYFNPRPGHSRQPVGRSRPLHLLRHLPGLQYCVLICGQHAITAWNSRMAGSSSAWKTTAASGCGFLRPDCQDDPTEGL